MVRTDGSAPRERRQLYFESLKAALAAARDHVLLATGYFVPTRQQWRLLAKAAERGVAVDLILAGACDGGVTSRTASGPRAPCAASC
jgi:cardiolipin synthase